MKAKIDEIAIFEDKQRDTQLFNHAKSAANRQNEAWTSQEKIFFKIIFRVSTCDRSKLGPGHYVTFGVSRSKRHP